MSELLERMGQARAKSSSNVSLLEHSLGVFQIVDHMVQLMDGFPLQQASALRLGAFFHDIGKLHPNFQSLLQQRQHIQHDVKVVKHEAQTYHFYSEVVHEIDRIAKWLEHYTETDIVVPDDIADVLAFAVTHHGLYYSSLENGVWLTRREWTRMNPLEERRITLADLLFRYFPLGGAVIFADMLHSEQIAIGRDNLTFMKKTTNHGEWQQEIKKRRDELIHAEEADRAVRLPHDLLELLLAY